MKKTVSVILSFILIINVCAIGDTVVRADSYYAVYEGEHGNSTCIFSIYELNNGSFSGHLYHSSSPYIDEDISGDLYRNSTNYRCVFIANNERNSFDIYVYPYEGRANCTAYGRGFILYEEFSMVGSTDLLYNAISFNSNDMKMCMDLSANSYKDTLKKTIKIGYEYDEFNINYTDFSIPENLINKLEEYSLFNLQTDDYSEMLSVNYKDHNKDNVAFTVVRRENDSNNDEIIESVDIIVVIRGTLKDEWQGNAELTGTEYVPNKNEHDNFYEAEDTIKEGIKAYYTYLTNKAEYNGKPINLIITGHSRGAAVANIYAKEATDVINSGSANEKIPTFNKVTAYTFATPNVHKYYVGMEDYDNIFNFCLDEDVVPTVPLTKPINGWDYWKFGKTFSFNVCKEYNQIINKYPFISPYATSDIWNAFSHWKSVDDYYNKTIYKIYGLPNLENTTMYDTLHDLTGIKPGVSIRRANISGNKMIKKVGIYPELIPVFSAAVANLGSIITAHNYTTYNDIVQKYGSCVFELVTHSDISEINDSRVPQIEYSVDNYNLAEAQLLINFANSYDNLSKLGWNLSEPLSWDGVYWDENGHIYGLDLSYKNLDGVLDISSFPYLKYMYFSGNNIHLQRIEYCIVLEEIDCSYNDYSGETLNLSSNTNLKKVYCNGCIRCNNKRKT